MALFDKRAKTRAGENDFIVYRHGRQAKASAVAVLLLTHIMTKPLRFYGI
jgi:hypothetical protein